VLYSRVLTYNISCNKVKDGLRDRQPDLGRLTRQVMLFKMIYSIYGW